MSEQRRREQALGGRGFGEAAADYVAGRPDYPVELVAWLVGDAVDVVDVGAGTGKLTAALVGGGRRVVAVEPDGGMLDALREQVPGARAVQGAAEALPLPDASADALLFGQAWHWVDVAAASAEAGRVLRPGGALGLIWNGRDSAAAWVRAMNGIIDGSAAEEAIEQDAVRVGEPFGPLERRSTAWSRPMTGEQIVAMVASRSYVIARDPGERAELLGEVRTLLASHPDTAGRARVDLPYRTSAFRAVRP